MRVTQFRKRVGGGPKRGKALATRMWIDLSSGVMLGVLRSLSVKAHQMCMSEFEWVDVREGACGCEQRACVDKAYTQRGAHSEALVLQGF